MSAALDLRSKEEKDAELDKRIEALRKKNEALIKRYQEIEEDRKKAELEGIAVTALRRGRPPPPLEEPERRWVDQDLSVTVQLVPCPREKRPVKEKKPLGAPRASRGPRGGGSERPLQHFGGGDSGGRGGRRPKGRGGAAVAGLVTTARGDGPDRKSKEWEERRRQNIEKMNEEMEKIAEYERNQRDGLHEKNPVRNFLDDPRRSGPFQEADRREGSRRHVRNWGGTSFDRVRAGMERDKSWQGPCRRPGAPAGPPLDMTLSMTGRQRTEYLRWKQERERIDRERLARHRQPGGQWRREWDAEKSDSMFKEDTAAEAPRGGDFPPQRRRKVGGSGQGAAPKAYSMHDNRWENEEPPAASGSWKAEEEPSGAAPPALLSPEEDEDQWEDVSEEEEEEEESSSSSGEAEAPCSASPPAQCPPHAAPGGAGGGGAPPTSPFSPLGGHQPVWDWGEEMEPGLHRGGPLVPKAGGASGEAPGLSPPEAIDPPRGVPTPPRGEEPRAEEPKEATGDLAQDGPPDTAAAEALPPPGSVEIADFERVRFRKNSPPPP